MESNNQPLPHPSGDDESVDPMSFLHDSNLYYPNNMAGQPYNQANMPVIEPRVDVVPMDPMAWVNPNQNQFSMPAQQINQVYIQQPHYDPGPLPEDQLSFLDNDQYEQIPPELQQNFHSRPPDEPYEPENNQLATRLADCCPYLIAVIMGVICLTIMFKGGYGLLDSIGSKYTAVADGSGILSYVSTSLKSPLLVDVALASNLTCPAGYSLLTFGTWPGTKHGCACGDEISSGTCSSDSQSSCEDVDSQSAVSIVEWRNVSLCAKYASEVTYTNSADCPSGYTKCYRDICVKSGQDCYVTDIVMRAPGAADKLGPQETADIGTQNANTTASSGAIEANGTHVANGTSVTNGTNGINWTNATNATNATNVTSALNATNATVSTSSNKKLANVWSTATSTSPNVANNAVSSPNPFRSIVDLYALTNKGTSSPGVASANTAYSPNKNTNASSISPDSLTITRSDLSISPNTFTSTAASSPNGAKRKARSSGSPNSRRSSGAFSPNSRSFYSFLEGDINDMSTRRMLYHDNSESQKAIQVFHGGFSLLEESSKATPNTTNSTKSTTTATAETKNANGLRTKITIDSQHELRLFRRTSVSPITTFSLTYDSLPCLANNRLPMPNSSEVYPLLNKIPTGCGDYGNDFDSAMIDMLPEEEVYLENGMTYRLYELPEYEKFIKNNALVWSSRPRVHLSTLPSCFQLQVSNADTVTELETKLNEMNVIYLAIAIVFGLLGVGAAGLMIWNKEAFGDWVGLVMIPIALVIAATMYYFTSQLKTEKENSAEISKYLVNLAKRNCFANSVIDTAIKDLATSLPEYIDQSIENGTVLFYLYVALSVTLVVMYGGYGIAKKLATE